jgi:general stress protein 26
MSLIDSKDSLEQIKATVLQALNRAGNDQGSAFRFIILNTIADGYPNSRYVVLRKFDIQKQELFIFTDFRSHKIKEIRENELVSVLAYDQQKKCQVKLKATATIHHNDQIAEEYWDSLDSGKDSYNTFNQPGIEKDSLEDAWRMKDEYDSQYFAVITLKILEVEVLQLHTNGHIRALFDFVKNTGSYLVP